MSQEAKVLDVRAIAHRERHPLIFATLDALTESDTLLLVNDHDPKPLYYQLQAVHPGQFTWEYREEGPDVWEVMITKQCC